MKTKPNKDEWWAGDGITCGNSVLPHSSEQPPGLSVSDRMVWEENKDFCGI